MIELRNVSKNYGDFVAVRDVSFRVDRGEIIGLVGPNGAGKTTTMKMITGYLVPTAGEVTVDGHDVAADPKYAQAQIGYLPEHNPLYPEMAVQDYLVFMGRMRGLGRAAVVDRLGVVVESCSLEDVVTRPIRHLSKGYRQRVGIAQAMIHDPDILILDEPTSGLDPNQIVEIRDLVRELGKNKTVILSTHILSEVEETCTRALMVVGGRLAVDDRIDRLVGGGKVHLRLRGAPEGAREKIVALAGVAEVAAGSDPAEAGLSAFDVTPKADASLGSALFDLAVREGWSVDEIARERRSLEDVFREASMAKGGPRS